MLKVIAEIRAAEGAEREAEERLRALIPPTVAEAGCVMYELWRDGDDPRRFVFDELWTTRADWEAHNASQHLAAHRAATEGLFESVTVRALDRVA